MSTKGAGNRYGNSRGGKIGHPTAHIGFAWAKDFNKHSVKLHFVKHGCQLNSPTQTSYVAKAVRFANTIDRKNNVSYVRKNGQTVKFNKKTGEFSVIDKKGYVVTYFKPDRGYEYYINDRRKK